MMAKNETVLTDGGSRRKFLTWFLGTTAGAFILSVLYPLSRYLIPPEVEESTAHTVTLAVAQGINSWDIWGNQCYKQSPF